MTGISKAERERRQKASKVTQDTIVVSKEQKPIPSDPVRKGLDPFTKSFVDMAATQAKQAIDLRFDNLAKSIAPQEAQSIGQASARLLLRHYGPTLKKFVPKGAQTDDANDFKEIFMAIGMWTMRWIKITIEESTQKKQLVMLKREEQIAEMRRQTAATSPQADTFSYGTAMKIAAYGSENAPSQGGVTRPPSVQNAQMRNDSRLMNELDMIMQTNGGTLGVVE